MATIERAVEIAARAHAGQRDKAGAVYLLHPLRLMLRMEDEAAMMAAVLHDVVEDTAWTLDDLAAEGFPPEVLAAVDRLTKRPGQPEEDYLDRLIPDPLAVVVKLADLEDNMNLFRIAEPTEKDLRRLAKYRRTWSRLRALKAD